MSLLVRYFTSWWKMSAPVSRGSLVLTRDGYRRPAFGLGVYESKGGGETEQAVLWALEEGYRLVDTAALYKNEDEVGAAIRKSGIPREEIFVTTKLLEIDHGKENTKAAFKKSLKNLGLEYIDTYLIHSPINGKIVESWDAMIELQKEKLVRSIGVSNFSEKHLRELKKARPNNVPAVNQVEYSPYLQNPSLVEYCRQEGILLEAYSPLTRGNKLKDPILVGIGAKYGKSSAQVLIRWCLQSGFICIPKSVTKERIKQNGDVFDFVLSNEDMTTLNGLDEGARFCWNPLETEWTD